jgi:hypothetical protein
MRIAKGHMVALGYGKYFRSDSIVGMEPIEEGRGPGKRTTVYVEHLPMPLIASRSEGAILRDLVEVPKEITKTRELVDWVAQIALQAMAQRSNALVDLCRRFEKESVKPAQ